jgi:hypothetical protein
MGTHHVIQSMQRRQGILITSKMVIQLEFGEYISCGGNGSLRAPCDRGEGEMDDTYEMGERYSVEVGVKWMIRIRRGVQ